MKLTKSTYPLVTLPTKMQLAISLIREELKSRKLFDTLHQVGLEESSFQPNLDRAIMLMLDLDDATDETFHLYTSILEKRAKKIEADNASITKQAVKAYHELISLRQNLTGIDR